MGHELQHYIDSMPPQGAIPMSPLLLSPIQDVSCLWTIPMPTATSGTPSGRESMSFSKVITNLGGGMGEGHCSWESCLGMASDGSAVCTGSWDTSLKVSVFLVVDYKLTVFTHWISVPAALE
ncbi:unnamed protein product [Sphagnum jensenii]|uniref:Uncharacterized protein n=1 Tax=Sphagnum jensenii TaxID=128206 RepID=A0ABP1A5S5_9BRYO